MPKVYYNPITKQNEWTYSKEEKEEMLKNLEKKPKRVLEPQETKHTNVCGGAKHNNHIPFNPNQSIEEEVFDWGDRYEN